MGFNLSGFIGGFSQKAVERIEDQEKRAQELADEQRRIATSQRLAREEERRKKQILAEETSGMLAQLGFSESNIASIMGNGNAAAQFAIATGQQALAKGVDVNTIFKYTGNTAELTEKDKVQVGEIIAAAPGKAAPVGLATGVSVGSEMARGVKPSVTEDNGYTFDTQAYANLFAEPAKYESSHSAALAVISQKLAREDYSRESREELEAQREAILADLRDMKAAEREEKGTETPSFDLGSITSMENQIAKPEYKRYGFEIGLDGTIQNITEGNRHMADIAALSIATQLNDINEGINDPNMALRTQSIYNTAVNYLAEYAYTTAENGKAKTAATDQEFLDTRYQPGDVVSVDGLLVVYTGIPDFTNQGVKYIIIG